MGQSGPQDRGAPPASYESYEQRSDDAQRGAQVRREYGPDQGLLPNPERGFYTGVRHCDRDPFDAQALAARRASEGNTLVICIFYLSDFKTTPISEAALAFFERQMAAARAAGVKVILRFAYTESTSGDDATVDQVMAHLDQLAPHLASAGDVIFVVQQGFIGAWGEGAYSINFGIAGKLTPRNVADRRAMLQKLLQVVPASRMVQVRTPQIKRTVFGPAALQASEAFSGSERARIGEHNDCFLNGPADAGTYSDTASEYPYLADETKFLPMGGETCGVAPPRTDCPSALSEMRRFHWTFLNLNYDRAVLDRWRTQGCFDEVRQHLGYRLMLVDGRFSTRAGHGGNFRIALRLRNVGWAAPVNSRPVELVMRRDGDGRQFRFHLDSDPRLWLPEREIAIRQRLTVPDAMPTGRYHAWLSLPDPAPSLVGRPEYAIAFVNAGVWQGDSGLNALNYELTVER